MKIKQHNTWLICAHNQRKYISDVISNHEEEFSRKEGVHYTGEDTTDSAIFFDWNVLVFTDIILSVLRIVDISHNFTSCWYYCIALRSSKLFQSVFLILEPLWRHNQFDESFPVLYDFKGIINKIIINKTIFYHSIFNHRKSNPDSHIQFDIILKRLSKVCLMPSLKRL